MQDPNDPFGGFGGFGTPAQVDVSGMSGGTTPRSQLNISQAPASINASNAPQTGFANVGFNNTPSMGGIWNERGGQSGGGGGGGGGWDPWGNAPVRQEVSMMTDRSESPWAALQRQNAQAQYGRAQGLVGAQANAGMQSGMNTMAGQGGLTGGGRVALANNATANRIKGTQALAGKYQDTLRNISGQDISNQINQENLESQRQYAGDQWDFEQKQFNYNNAKQADAQQSHADRTKEEAFNWKDPKDYVDPLNVFGQRGKW